MVWGLTIVLTVGTEYIYVIQVEGSFWESIVTKTKKMVVKELLDLCMQLLHYFCKCFTLTWLNRGCFNISNTLIYVETNSIVQPAITQQDNNKTYLSYFVNICAEAWMMWINESSCSKRKANECVLGWGLFIIGKQQCSKWSSLWPW